MIVKKGDIGLLAAIALGSSNLFTALPTRAMPDLKLFGGTTRFKGPSGSPKRNQERSVKRQAQRSRVINRMRRK